MTIKTDEEQGLPVAQRIIEDAESNTSASKALLGGAKEKESDYSYQYAQASAPPQEGGQQYWGRFNDPQVHAEPVNADEAAAYVVGGGPIVVARVDDRRIRHAFIRKVYLILTAQMVLTFGVCAAMALYEPVKTFCLNSMWLYYVNMVSVFVLICALQFYKRSYPTNFILLGMFTFCMAYMIGIVTSVYAENGASDLILEAVFITATVFFILSVFTLQTKYDFSFLGAGLGMSLWILILWSFFGAIFGMQTGSVYALLGSVVFSLYIIYDTYMISERLDPQDYIIAAIELYLDLINLFLMILRLLSDSDRR